MRLIYYFRIQNNTLPPWKIVYFCGRRRHR